MTWTEAITLMSKSPGDAQAVYNPDSQQWTVTQGRWVTSWRRGVRMVKTDGATALGALKQLTAAGQDAERALRDIDIESLRESVRQTLSRWLTTHGGIV